MQIEGTFADLRVLLCLLGSQIVDRSLSSRFGVLWDPRPFSDRRYCCSVPATSANAPHDSSSPGSGGSSCLVGRIHSQPNRRVRQGAPSPKNGIRIPRCVVSGTGPDLMGAAPAHLGSCSPRGSGPGDFPGGCLVETSTQSAECPLPDSAVVAVVALLFRLEITRPSRRASRGGQSCM